MCFDCVKSSVAPFCMIITSTQLVRRKCVQSDYVLLYCSKCKIVGKEIDTLKDEELFTISLVFK